MSTFIQRSFAGGEVSPSVYGRVDQTKYTTGLRTCRNFMVMRHGGVATRPGTGLSGEAKDSTRKCRLIPFIFNSEQTYALELGHEYIRFHRNGGQLIESGFSISAITKANPAVVSAAGHTFINGDEVFISGLFGMGEVSQRNFRVANVGAGTFELEELDGNPVDSSGFSAYISGGSVAKIFEIATPYDEDDLFDIKFVQSADVVTLVHPSYEPRNLSRLSDTSWTLDIIEFRPSIDRPHGATVAAGPAGSDTLYYKVTAIDADTREESLPGSAAAGIGLTALTVNISPPGFLVTTASPHGLAVGDEVRLDGGVFTGTAPTGFLKDVYRVISVPGASQFVIPPGFVGGTYSSGGTMYVLFLTLGSAGTPTTSNPHTITIPLLSGASEYNIYKSVNGVFGFLGISGDGTFKDVGLDPDTLDTPPASADFFSEPGAYPSTVSYYQQRKLFANTLNDPEKVFASRTGSFDNFTTSSPLQDDDAVTFTLAGRQVNAVRHMIDLGGLVMLTTGGEWQAKGNAAGILVPGEVNPQQISYNGASEVPPLIVGNTALYVQGRGSIIRDLGFDYQVDNYKGNDLTIFSAHLFDKHRLIDWSFQQIPHSVVWVVRDDGLLLGLTYVREHQVWGWHRHDFDGFVESVVSIPEGNEDAVYLIIRRTINGRQVRYVERFKTRQVDDIKDYVGMDAALTYDGRNTNGSSTMTLTGGTAWDQNEVLTLTSSSPVFLPGDPGNDIQLTAADGSQVRLRIETYSGSTIVLVRPQRVVPVDLRAAATSAWAKAVDVITGLQHLEGKQISVLGDGFVVANPNNDSYLQLVVTNGVAVLDRPYAVIHAGLPITSDLYTLDVDTAQGETVVDKKKFISRLTIFVEESRGIFAGTAPPASDSSLDGLYELKIRNTEGYDDPVALRTGVVDLNIEPSWNKHGRVFIRQTDPLPLSVLAVAPSGLVPIRG